VGLVNGAIAWNARYKYDEPSTSNNVFFMVIPEMSIVCVRLLSSFCSTITSLIKTQIALINLYFTIKNIVSNSKLWFC
jgi:hypothetical protein